MQSECSIYTIPSSRDPDLSLSTVADGLPPAPTALQKISTINYHLTSIAYHDLLMVVCLQGLHLFLFGGQLMLELSHLLHDLQYSVIKEDKRSILM